MGKEGEKKVILINNGGYGLLDLAGYDKFLMCELLDTELPKSATLAA